MFTDYLQILMWNREKLYELILKGYMNLKNENGLQTFIKFSFRLELLFDIALL